MVRVAFLWHMHQPFYLDSAGSMRLPWVFLHAIKDYYDMPYLAERYNASVSFNITPSLIKQLNLYAENGVKSDCFLKLITQKPSELSSKEREWVVKICKSSQFDTMVKPLEKYAELYDKNSLDDKELTELEVLFLLSWCGNYLRKNSEIVAELLKKQKDYDENDKNALIHELLLFIKKILPFYKELYKNNKIELLTTPYAHPILPLLIDLTVAGEEFEEISEGLSLKDDAEEHVRRAIDIFKRTFESTPYGFWPAEGSVSEDAVNMLKNNGIKWAGSDQDILQKSIDSADIYKTYDFNGILMGFRDKELSDKIGFVYKAYPTDKAIDDFIYHLKKIEKNYKSAIVYVILDGENAWEFYPNNGYDFLSGLYEKMVEDESIELVRISEPEADEELKTLSSGSWIFGNFSTWVGDNQKNRAWELLFLTKKDFLRHKDKLDKESLDKIQELFLMAEASDWFWWYGEGHYSEHELEYDRLYRNNLIQIYKILGINPPAALFEPITKYSDVSAIIVQPKFEINPVIDGKITSFFEWLGSGVIDESRSFSTMDTTRGPIHKIYFGQNKEKLFVRFDGEIDELRRKGELLIHAKEFEMPLRISLKEPVFEENIEVASYKIIEMALSKRMFKSNRVGLRFELVVEDRVVQILPSLREMTINLEEDFAKNWFV
ncbi:glycoside hydrolase family 57 protein [Hippea alviniae]|uniref:glycoside hydrolase family 57 protein n=1 Tax=Hippea alviniae TaxID=1279027 RepID=UPI0003B65DF4|nr:glycoside hydrolase family 57 protein [Hippea alviniae]